MIIHLTDSEPEEPDPQFNRVLSFSAKYPLLMAFAYGFLNNILLSLSTFAARELEKTHPAS